MESRAHPRGCGDRDLLFPPRLRRASRVRTRHRLESGGHAGEACEVRLLCSPLRVVSFDPIRPLEGEPAGGRACFENRAHREVWGSGPPLSAASHGSSNRQRCRARLLPGACPDGHGVRLAQLPPSLPPPSPQPTHGDRPTAGHGPLTPRIAVRARVPVPTACGAAPRGTPRSSSCASPRGG